MGSINRALIGCSCGSSPTYARTQFKIKFPDEPEPPMYIAKKGYSLLEKLPPNSEIQKHILFSPLSLRRKGDTLIC